MRLQYPIADLAQQLDRIATHVVVILDDQQAFLGSAMFQRRLRAFLLIQRPVTHQAGEVDFDGRSFSLLGMDAHVAARSFHESIDLAEAEPGPLAAFLGREERLESAGGNLSGHPVADVADGDIRSEYSRGGEECVRT